VTDRGFVLVNVLILVAALSAVAVGLLQISARATVRLDAGQGAAQAPLVIDAGVAFAVQLLQQDARANRSDHPGGVWAISDHVAETALGPVRISVFDLEARLNVNRPLGADGAGLQAALTDLIVRAGGGADLAAALETRHARIRADAAAVPDRNGDIMYQSGDLTHLAALPGAGGAQGQRALLALRDARLFAALPRARGVNVNTAKDPVLAALPGVTPEVLAALNAARRSAPIADRAALSDVLLAISPEALGLAAFLETQSHWFEVETETRIDGLTYRGRTVLSRRPASEEVRVHLHAIAVSG